MNFPTRKRSFIAVSQGRQSSCALRKTQLTVESSPSQSDRGNRKFGIMLTVIGCWLASASGARARLNPASSGAARSALRPSGRVPCRRPCCEGRRACKLVRRSANWLRSMLPTDSLLEGDGMIS
eukprot:6188178-Pleurochrysis_carterae.AAC.4